jgi:2-hydroxychromene-2-carboxylate isomerase
MERRTTGTDTGDVIALADFRSRRAAKAHLRASWAASSSAHGAFYFDLASPFTYLAAERVERAFPGIDWIPAVVAGAHVDHDTARRRAVALRLPLTCPDSGPDAVPEAMRVAAYAAEQGRAAAFVLAASRLAWAGGFDLRDVSVLAEAATAAGLAMRDALAAAREAERDPAMLAAGEAVAPGPLPVVVLAGAMFAGEERLAEAVAYARARPGAAGA